MAKLVRHPVSKHKSVKVFRHNVSKTKAANVQPHPMRGGYRL